MKTRRRRNQLFARAKRGKYAGRMGEGVTMVMIDPDVTEFFPDSEAVDAG